ncbi:alpha/beta fold hydrolase [Tomitella biformata]|uniref:alpha/beta fold hydrolase n=1 Tax=Tomitella biformata TaxID=630403 RepID=UPI0004B6DD94|nr:alpha/beta hydrolase [Tomitella biformata]
MSTKRNAPGPFLHIGAGEPVLLIHPFLMTHEVWSEVAQRLAPDHEVLAVTLPGHWGGPDAAWNHMGISDMADGLEQVLDQHGWDTCHVVGNSLGGWVAFELERRGRARSVTAIAPAGGWTSISVPAIRLGITFLALAPVMVLAKPFVGWAAGVRRLQKAAMSMVAANPAAVPPAVAERAMWAAVQCNSILPILWAAAWDDGIKGLKDTQTPTQLLLCDKDRVIPWRLYGQMFIDELPASTRRIILPEVGHVPMVEDPVLVARVIREFVDHHAANQSEPAEA